MKEFESVRVSGGSFDEFSRALTSTIQNLPSEMRKRLHEIRRNYFAWYGFEGAYQRMNDRTVSQIANRQRIVELFPAAHRGALRLLV